MDKSHFHFTLGDLKCIAIRDGGHMGSADFLFVNAPPVELSTILHEQNLERNQLPSTWTCLLVDTGKKKLLVDTGIGSGDSRGGTLLPQLELLGYRPNDIDVVFLTHGHPDHVGGCTGEDDKLVFSHAQYMIDKREFEFWTAKQNQGDTDDWVAQFACQKLLAIEDQLELVGSDAELLPGIKTVEAYGHTPGHLGLEFRSQDETLLNLADSVLHPLNLEHPEWYSRIDILPEQMIATRVRLLERAAREKALVLFTHFQFPSLGYVEQDGKRWSWRSI